MSMNAFFHTEFIINKLVKKEIRTKKQSFANCWEQVKEVGISTSESTLKSLIWKQKIHNINQLKSICIETNTLIEKLNNKSNYLIPFIFDLSLKSFCKDYGLDGLRCYINNRGLRNFSQGKIFGLKFAYDCFKKKFHKEIH